MTVLFVCASSARIVCVCVKCEPVCVTGLVHGYYHQEWHCNYADQLYTNKSVAYAVSHDGGHTFLPSPAPGPSNPGANQIIAGANFSATHQTGEGDHTVVRVGDWLYLYFIEWDGPHGEWLYAFVWLCPCVCVQVSMYVYEYIYLCLWICVDLCVPVCV